jgi:2'-5' RNA ligase superfamily
LSSEAAPIILTATMGGEDAAWATALRDQHFPAERNYLRAHITLFHHLPGPQWPLVKDAVKRLCANNPPPVARIDRLINLGRGVAFHVDSSDLLAMREEMADGFFGLLTPQDSNKPRLHITVQNKVEPSVARKLLQAMESEFTPRPLSIIGIDAHYYRGGPWEPIQGWRFRG